MKTRLVLPLIAIAATLIVALTLSLANVGHRSGPSVDWAAVKAAGAGSSEVGTPPTGPLPVGGVATDTAVAATDPAVDATAGRAPKYTSRTTQNPPSHVDVVGPTTTHVDPQTDGWDPPVVWTPDDGGEAHQDHSETRHFGMAGGTYLDRSAGLIGTAFVYPATVADGDVASVTIQGPAGWNQDNPFNCGRWTPPGSAQRLLPCWTFVPPVSGRYHAATVVAGQTYAADFHVDAGEQLDAPRITDHTVSTSDAQASWSGTDADSYILRVNNQPPTDFYETTTGGDARSARLSGMHLDDNSSYQLVVFAFSTDLTNRGGDVPDSFDVSADSVVFTPASDTTATQTQMQSGSGDAH